MTRLVPSANVCREAPERTSGRGQRRSAPGRGQVAGWRWPAAWSAPSVRDLICDSTKEVPVPPAQLVEPMKDLALLQHIAHDRELADGVAVSANLGGHRGQVFLGDARAAQEEQHVVFALAQQRDRVDEEVENVGRVVEAVVHAFLFRSISGGTSRAAPASPPLRRTPHAGPESLGAGLRASSRFATRSLSQCSTTRPRNPLGPRSSLVPETNVDCFRQTPSRLPVAEQACRINSGRQSHLSGASRN